MIEASDILSYGRYTKYPQPFTGSYNGMRYRIMHPKAQEGEDDVYVVDIWPEPLCYESTPQEEVIKQTFMYTKENFDKIVPYLNEMYNLYIDKWENARV